MLQGASLGILVHPYSFCHIKCQIQVQVEVQMIYSDCLAVCMKTAVQMLTTKSSIVVKCCFRVVEWHFIGQPRQDMLTLSNIC